MGRAASRFREADVKRAIIAASKAGRPNARIVIEPDGRIIIYPGDDATAQPEPNPFD